jgi:hypothetical protein
MPSSFAPLLTLFPFSLSTVAGLTTDEEEIKAGRTNIYRFNNLIFHLDFSSINS